MAPRAFSRSAPIRAASTALTGPCAASRSASEPPLAPLDDGIRPLVVRDDVVDDDDVGVPELGDGTRLPQHPLLPPPDLVRQRPRPVPLPGGPIPVRGPARSGRGPSGAGRAAVRTGRPTPLHGRHVTACRRAGTRHGTGSRPRRVARPRPARRPRAVLGGRGPVTQRVIVQREFLDGDAPPRQEAAGPPHHAHAAPPEAGVQAVTPRYAPDVGARGPHAAHAARSHGPPCGVTGHVRPPAGPLRTGGRAAGRHLAAPGRQSCAGASRQPRSTVSNCRAVASHSPTGEDMHSAYSTPSRERYIRSAAR